MQPVSPVFLYAHTDSERTALPKRYADEFAELQSEFTELTKVSAHESVVLILRLTTAETTPLPGPP